MIKNMTKNIILGTIIIISIIGCSDKKEENTELKKEAVKEVTTQQAPLKIEVVKNANANAIKVEEKVKDGKENESYYYDYNVKSEYDPNAKPANEDAAVRVKPRSIIDANMHVRSPYEKVKVSMLVKKLSKDFIVKCSACHNDYANGVIGPSLLNKDASFIFNKIMKFKQDPKANVLMTALVKQMSDEEIQKLADEIFNFNKEIKGL